MHPGYKTGGVNPLSSGLRNILAFYGTRAPHSGEAYTEAMVFGLSGGIGIAALSRHAGGQDPLPMLSVANILQGDGEVFLRGAERLHATVRVHETTDAREAERALRDMLTDGKAGAIRVKAASLPYSMQLPGLDDWFGRDVVICGYDATQDQFELDDRAPRPWRVPASALAEARSGSRAFRHRLMDVEAPQEYPDLVATIRTGIGDCVAAMLRPQADGTGLPGLAAWARRIRDKGDAEGWPNLFPPGQALHRAMIATYFAVVCAGTGGNALRRLYADFLEEASGVTGEPQYGEVAGLFRLSGKLWQRFAESLLPDNVGRLRKTRALLNTNRRLFEQEGEAVWPGIAANLRELEEIHAEMADAFPMKDAAVAELLDDLGEQLLAIHELESAAIEALDATITRT